MASWDGIVDIKRGLDEYSKAAGFSYVLIVSQGTEETPRVVAKAMGALRDDCGPHVFFALDQAAYEIFEEMADHLGIEEDPDA